MRLCNHKICKFWSRKITKLADLAKNLERYFTELQRLNDYLRFDYIENMLYFTIYLPLVAFCFRFAMYTRAAFVALEGLICDFDKNDNMNVIRGKQF